jgi:hypothetical protein
VNESVLKVGGGIGLGVGPMLLWVGQEYSKYQELKLTALSKAAEAGGIQQALDTCREVVAQCVSH